MSIKSDYEKVCEFNKAFDFPQYDNFLNEKILKLRLDLIKEEITELKEAYSNNDTVEILDACADILYVAYGMAYTYRFDSDYIMNNRYYCMKKKTLFESLTYELTDRKSILIKLFDTFSDLVKYTNEQNTEGVIDFLHKIIYFVYNFQSISGYNSDKIFNIVHNSNMSKLCKNEDEAKLTVDDYKQKYLDGKSPYDSPYHYRLDNGLYVVKNKSTGKALKNINYTKVKLS